MEQQQAYFGLDDSMFSDQKIEFHSFKNGEHKFRVLPPYAPKKLFHKVKLHWGYTTQEGKKKPLTCTKDSHGACPICDIIEKNKGMIDNIEAALVTEVDPMKRQELESKKAEMSDYNSNFRAKPTYLWNILTEEGTAKVLQLSWNGHDPLYSKIKFYFSQKRIDVTNPTQNFLMYANRSGQMAKTRYTYEVLDGTERKIDLPTLKDLSKIYTIKTPEYLAEVVNAGIIPGDNEDPNDRNFNAAPATQPAAQPVAQQAAPVAAQPVQQPVAQPAPQTQVEQPVAQQPVTPQPEAQTQVQMEPQQDAAIQEMMNALKA